MSSISGLTKELCGAVERYLLPTSERVGYKQGESWR